jgi:hypothetical protein
MQARHLHLTPDDYVLSAELRDWCVENPNRCFIPEWLLAAWDIYVNPDLGSYT